MKKILGMIALFAIATAVNAQSPGPLLKIGDPAPKLAVAKWLQGEPVNGLEKGTAYVVEFWATWCGPCRKSVPHLNDIHTRFRDKSLVVIGQNCWEKDESKVQSFLDEMKNEMTYRVALDMKKEARDPGAMAETWMKAAGRSGIPSAFIVDKTGTIAWIGHPMQIRDEMLESILAGKWDLAKALADYEEAERKKAEMRKQASEARKKTAAEK